MKKIVFIVFSMVIIFTGCTSQYEDVTDPLERKIIESFDNEGFDNISYEITDGDMNIYFSDSVYVKNTGDMIKIPVVDSLKDIQGLNNEDIEHIKYNFKVEGEDTYATITFINEEVMQMDFENFSYNDIMQYSFISTNSDELREHLTSL